MVDGRWRRASGLLLLPAAMAGFAGCRGGTGRPAAATTASVPASAAEYSSAGTLSATELRSALLTRVNGVAAATPASSGKYASLPGASTGEQAKSIVQVIPKVCAGAATTGFDPVVLAGAPAAAVTFRVGANGVSEVLIASSATSASAALAGHVPAECARYQEKVEGKTFTYETREQAIAGIGKEARVLNVHADGATSDNLWSLIYRGDGFIGAVTVIGPNASELAVRELGQQAYAFAAKTLS
jgi:hypothetical protein